MKNDRFVYPFTTFVLKISRPEPCLSALAAVMAYLSMVKPDYEFALSAKGTLFDLIGTKVTTGAIIGVEVKYASIFTRRIFDRITTRVFDYAQNETSFEEIIIIFAYEGNRHVPRTIRAIQSLSNIPPRVTFLVGVISINDGSPLFIAHYQQPGSNLLYGSGGLPSSQ